MGYSCERLVIYMRCDVIKESVGDPKWHALPAERDRQSQGIDSSVKDMRTMFQSFILSILILFFEIDIEIMATIARKLHRIEGTERQLSDKACEARQLCSNKANLFLCSHNNSKIN